MIIFAKLSLYQNKYQKIILGWTSPLISHNYDDNSDEQYII